MTVWLNVAKKWRWTAAVVCMAGGGQIAQAGVLDLLRGEPVEEIYQRVAFVGSAEVKEVRGTVERLSGIEEWELLRERAALRPGDVIRTGAGMAVLRMEGSGSYVKATPRTILRLVQIEKDWERSILSGREEREGFVVRSCRGKAYHNADGEWEAVAVNHVLARGVEVRTGPGAVVDLFDTETQQPVRIRGSGRVTLDEQVLARRVTEQPSLAAAGR